MPTILISDDREENRYVLLNFFKLFGSNSNLNIIESSNTKDTIDMIKKNKPDLVLLDIRMDTDDAGFVVLNTVRNDPELKDTTIWAISAKNEYKEISKEMLNSNYKWDDFILKPYNPVELLLKVSNLLKVEIPSEIKQKMNI